MAIAERLRKVSVKYTPHLESVGSLKRHRAGEYECGSVSNWQMTRSILRDCLREYQRHASKYATDRAQHSLTLVHVVGTEAILSTRLPCDTRVPGVMWFESIRSEW